MHGVIEKDKPMFRDAAREAFDAADGDVGKATTALYRMLNSRKSLRDKKEQILRNACHEELLAIRTEKRAAIVRIANAKLAATHAPPTPRQRLHAHAAALMEFELPLAGRSCKLRNATVGDLEEGTNRYMRHGWESVRRGKWLEAIKGQMPNDPTKQVGDVMTEEQLQTLWNETEPSYA